MFGGTLLLLLSGSSGPPDDPIATGSDRHILRAVAALLADSGQFDAIHRARGIDVRGRAADRSAIALVYQDGWDESPEWDDDEETGSVRIAKFFIEVVVRDPRDEIREDRLGVLSDVASNLINHKSLASISIPRRTYLLAGRYSDANPPEQSLKIRGEAAYFVDSPSAHDEDDSDE